MPRPGPTLALLLSAASVTLAQAPPVGQPPPVGGQPAPVAPPAVGQQPAPAVPAALMAQLQQWQQVMQGAKNFATECTKTVQDTVGKRETRYKGAIWCMKPNLARVRLEKLPAPGQQANPNEFEAYICDGRAVFAYDGVAKTVTVHPIQNQGVGDNLLLEFMAGTMTADQVVKRFAVAELPGKANDPNYLYLDVQPLSPKDTAEFDKLTLVLIRPALAPAQAYLPRTAQIIRKRGQEIETWDFPQPVQNAPNVAANAFQYVPPDKSWKVQQAQQPPAAPQGQGQPPRVIRQN